MKFSISSADFLKGLMLANKSLQTKANLPILSNVFVQALGREIEIVSTNLETATRVRLPAKVERGGETTLMGRAFGEFVGQLEAGGEILFEKLGEEAVVISGSYNARFATMDAAEFPAIPKFSGGHELKIRKKDLEKGILGVSFCAAQDESRPVLTGVLCEISKNRLKLVATDGYRLGYYEVEIQKVNNEQAVTFIIPAKSLVEVAKIISELGEGEDKKEPQGFVSVLVSENLTQAVFKIGEVEFTSRLIEGEFPNWQKIIPSTFATRAEISRVELARVVKMASIFARESGNIIKLNLNPATKGKSTISVNAVTAQVGSASGSVEAKLEGKGGEIAFNFRYLLDVLSVVAGEDVVFEMNESLNPGKITGVGVDSSFHIIMPVRLQG